MAQIRRVYDVGGSDRSPRRDFRPITRSTRLTIVPNAVTAPCPPDSWILAPGSSLSLHPSPLLDLDLILHFCRRAKSLEETEVAGAGCGYLE